jgi:hypothetical protein
LPVGQKPVQPRLQKYSASRLTQITRISIAVSSHRGALRGRHGRGMDAHNLGASRRGNAKYVFAV